MKQVYLLLFAALFAGSLFAQSDTTATIKAYGFADIYYVYDFNAPSSRQRPSFVYSHHRHNEFTINNAVIGLKYNTAWLRSAVAFHAGTYVEQNYAAEPLIFRYIYEANAGVKFGKKLWLDVGVFSSHIGYESALSKDNWTLTRSLSSENTPYYESGAKLSWEINSKWTLTTLLLNGWQNMRDNNSNKALGTQLVFKPSDRLTLNSSSFIGNEKPDSIRQMRYYHNLYAIYQYSERFALLAAFDIGAEEKAYGKGTNQWHCGSVIARYQLSASLITALRAEYYSDPHGVIISYPNGFRTGGYSMNFDYSPVVNVVLRAEGKVFFAPSPIFETKNGLSSRNGAFTASMAVNF